MKKVLYLLIATVFAFSFTAAVQAGACKTAVKACWKVAKAQKGTLTKAQKKAARQMRKRCRKKSKKYSKAKCKKKVAKFATAFAGVAGCEATAAACNPVADDDTPDDGDTGGGGDTGGF